MNIKLKWHLGAFLLLNSAFFISLHADYPNQRQSRQYQQNDWNSNQSYQQGNDQGYQDNNQQSNNQIQRGNSENRNLQNGQNYRPQNGSGQGITVQFKRNDADQNDYDNSNRGYSQDRQNKSSNRNGYPSNNNQGQAWESKWENDRSARRSQQDWQENNDQSNEQSQKSVMDKSSGQLNNGNKAGDFPKGY